ncbi:3-deoxy-manno-octulosonate cytidylyltransferase [Roseivivax sediminis]|uniref:3-deoxy-manno-octulosonate cytidylyltransferase (CMP-KDO synthetase) n=1 Tax=Roseivivax sediminis TaxID=936889 RepID=A0A1I2CVT9_9RHOB|nr:manno-octulosonate cytidylyltransferase [Roseivivax sediminis]SFE72389.1 3-deoxy-manno-octulosonate cytidylyltransferase (CMP-KDO synthetase) [Roseivivax sediminis]
MTTTILIPARYASTRYPGKPLATLTGPDGAKTLIQRSWEAAMSVPEADNVFVATDDERIAEASRGFGAEVIMTDEACRNGTERCADALARTGMTPDIVVNLQGDAPLTPAWFLSDLIQAMKAEESLDAATPVLRCDPETLSMLIEDRDNGRVGGTTAVFDTDYRALYFSKEVIPFTGGKTFAEGEVPVFHHVGVYAYRTTALTRYIDWPEGRMEKLEGLEQLRFLENGARMKCVEVDARGRIFWELNNPEDIARIEQVLNRDGTL